MSVVLDCIVNPSAGCDSCSADQTCNAEQTLALDVDVEDTTAWQACMAMQILPKFLFHHDQHMATAIVASSKRFK